MIYLKIKGRTERNEPTHMHARDAGVVGRMTTMTFRRTAQLKIELHRFISEALGIEEL